MSQYLSHFYCGNTQKLCNYNKPIKYSDMLNRQFDMEQYDVVNNCKGYNKTKGYCCDSQQTNPMDKEYMEYINKEFGHTIFHKNDNGEILDSVPLIKPIRNEKNEITSIDVCGCDGNEEEYRDCVRKNCKDFKIPSQYEYCKMGNNDNTHRCLIDNNSDDFGRCKLASVNDKNEYSQNFRINDIYPDCYLNLCNKDKKIHSLEKVTPNNYDNDTGFQKIESNTNINKKKNSIADFLKL